MIKARLQEAVPGQSAVDEDVRPEISGRRVNARKGEFALAKQIAKIPQEDAKPGFGRNQEDQLRGRCFSLFQLERPRNFAHRSMLDGK